MAGRGRQISEFKDILVYRASSRQGYTEKSCLGKVRGTISRIIAAGQARRDIMTEVSNHSTKVTEAGGSLCVPGQTVLHSKIQTTIVYRVRPHLKNRKNKQTNRLTI